jgi:ubiquinol-cytochrome c reductase iron-sulfur subunit
VSDPDHQPSRTRVPMPIAALSDPHMGDAAKHPARVEKIIAVIFLLAIGFFALFGAAYWQNWSPWELGGAVGVGLFLLGFGLTAWGKYLMAQGPFVEDRHPLASKPEERDAMAAAIVQRGGVVVKRRTMLTGLLVGGLGIFGIVALFPLVRSLGPVPENDLSVTNWRKGSYLVYQNGTRIQVGEIQPGGIATVFPEGHEDDEQAQAVDQTVLIRLPAPVTVPPGLPGTENWTPQGYVAYSKVCTHLGCPVGLYEQELELLVCPCHQSMFKAYASALPQFGPAPRPLPQLPLYIDSSGHLRAQSGYDQPVGPGFWERS